MNLLATHQIGASTPAWKQGTQERMPLGSIEVFGASPYAAPRLDTSPYIDPSGYSPSGPQVRPWVRYWARIADLFLFAILVMFLCTFVTPGWMNSLDTTVGGAVWLFLFCFVESLFLAMWGATPFKALLNVRVRNNNGSRLSYRQALQRSIHVWIMGMGAGLHFLIVVANFFSLARLSGRGITPWDARGNLIVNHRKIAWWRWMLLVSPVAAGWLWGLWLFVSRSR